MVAQILLIQVGLPKLLGVTNSPDPIDRPWSTPHRDSWRHDRDRIVS